MFETLISLGQAASHSPWLVQWPKPGLVHRSPPSCARADSARAGPGAGERAARPWPTTKSMAEAFGQAATQAPQPMQAAASMARSAFSLGTGKALPSGARPVGAETKPPDGDDAVEGAAVHDEVLDHGEGLGPPGLERDLVAVLELRMWSWQAVVARAGAVGRAVDHHAAGAADALAAVVVEGDRVLALRRSSSSFTTSSISRNDMSGLTPLAS